MNLRNLLVGAVVGGSIAAAMPASAASIVLNQWYGFGFGSTVGSSVFSPAFFLGDAGPLPGGGLANAINSSPDTSWTVTLPTSGYVVFTDLETAGDQFQVFVNGTPGIPTTNNLNPSGQAGQSGGDTSNPGRAGYIGESIFGGLATPNFSSGTFLLPAGTDTITANFIGGVFGEGVDPGFGDGAFLASIATPLPSTWTLMLIGLVGLGFVAHRRPRPNALLAA